jgi:hypothetical protein
LLGIGNENSRFEFSKRRITGQNNYMHAELEDLVIAKSFIGKNRSVE